MSTCLRLDAGVDKQTNILLPSALWCCWLGVNKSIRSIKNEWWGAGVIICLKRGANCYPIIMVWLGYLVHCVFVCMVKAKFHYTSWFGASSELALNRFRASSKPAPNNGIWLLQISERRKKDSLFDYYPGWAFPILVNSGLGAAPPEA